MSYRTHRFLNIILAFLYMPLSVFGFLLGMATEGTIGESNLLVIVSCYVLAWSGMLTPLVSYGGLFISRRMFEIGQIRNSLFARFAGLIFVTTYFLLSILLEWLSQFVG